MKILITGGTGLLGKALVDISRGKHRIIATYVGNYSMCNTDRTRYEQLDVRDSVGYDRLIGEFKPDVVIHTAGIGSPDYTETHRELVTDINVNGTRNLLRLCEKYNSRFVYISSNGIYDGEHAPYAEDDIAEPVNYYGEVKLKGEEITCRSQVSFAIIRPILMYGWPFSFERDNIVTLAISKLRKGEAVHAYDDVFANPLLNTSCASAIWDMIEKDRFSVYNVAGSDRVSIYELLIRTAEIFDLDRDLISPVQQGFFNELAPRPSDTSFKTNRIEKELGFRPLSIREGLINMKGTDSVD